MTLEESFLAWRKERVTVEQVEAQSILDGDEPLRIAFDDWREMKRFIQPGDELWTFRSPQELWSRFMGWEGLVLVRGGKLVEVVVTAQN